MNPKNRNALAERVVKAAEAALAAQGSVSTGLVPDPLQFGDTVLQHQVRRMCPRIAVMIP